jgi:hypothetical protein
MTQTIYSNEPELNFCLQNSPLSSLIGNIVNGKVENIIDILPWKIGNKYSQ